ncbi:MAG: hypothetical protein IT536_10915 [Hyphomicrobiales bacterium]|nr:hypothetical protein [Hyphomicrobiales bacterium]
MIGKAYTGATAILALLFMMPPTVAKAEAAADYFRGKTVRLLVPSGPGGDRGLYAGVFAPFFGKNIPGNPNVVVSFMPGAGGATAINYTYSIAAPDGLTLLTPLPAIASAQAVGDASAKYDVLKFNWVGRIADGTRILLLSSKVKAKTVPELRGREAIIASAGRASESYLMPAFMNKIMGTRFKILTGYQSASKRNLAIENGEVDGAITTWNDVRTYHPEWVREGGIMRVIVQFALQRHPDLQHLPLLLDYAENAPDRQLIEFMSSSSQMGQSYALPPGVPAPLVATLRRAFDATMKDPAFLEKVKSSRIDFNPVDGEAMTAVVRRIMETPKDVIERYKVATVAD